MKKANLPFTFRLSARSLVGCAFFLALAFGSNAFTQDTKKVSQRTGTSLLFVTIEVIPDVSEACVTPECNWWRQIRKTGSDLQQKGDIKSKRKFAEVLLVGLENDYRVPISDRAPLWLTAPRRTENPFPKHVRPKNGEVELSIEVRDDGSVGEMKVIKGLNSLMDKTCIESHKEGIYLPAVRNGYWVASWISKTCKYWSLNGL